MNLLEWTLPNNTPHINQCKDKAVISCFKHFSLLHKERLDSVKLKVLQ